MSRYAAVIYDLDGTLLDTLEEIAASCNAVLARAGLPVHPVDSYRGFVGDGVGTLVSRMLPEESRTEASMREVSRQVAREYQRRGNALTSVFEGVPGLLDGQSRLGIPMSILSNKPHDLTLDCVAKFLSGWKFSSVLGQREDLPRKPSPEGALRIAGDLGLHPASVLYVGDTNVDMMTAAAAGMPSVGVLWGFREASELRQAGAGALAEAPGDILSLLEGGKGLAYPPARG